MVSCMQILPRSCKHSLVCQVILLAAAAGLTNVNNVWIHVSVHVKLKPYVVMTSLLAKTMPLADAMLSACQMVLQQQGQALQDPAMHPVPSSPLITV